jgi:hypothetical protein
MFCPKCNNEYAEGIGVCTSCGMPLVETLPGGDKIEYIELVTIMETRDRALIAFIKSIFKDAGIRYFIKGETLLGLGRAELDVKIQVDKNDAEPAAELLKDVI